MSTKHVVRHAQRKHDDLLKEERELELCSDNNTKPARSKRSGITDSLKKMSEKGKIIKESQKEEDTLRKSTQRAAENKVKANEERKKKYLDKKIEKSMIK